ncbi:MAG: methyltransferase domain-containing protein [Phycisphaerae bacterium]
MPEPTSPHKTEPATATATKTLAPARPIHALWFALGLTAMAANKVRHLLWPYHRPRPFSPDDFTAAAEYDLRVFENWKAHLHESLGRPYDWTGKTVLELGPGPDLGTGVLALAAGASRYAAFDRFPLARTRSLAFYDHLLKRLPARLGIDVPKVARLRQQVVGAMTGCPSPLTYVHRKDFDLSAAGLFADKFADKLAKQPADLIISQAAFEHFDDPAATIAQLGRLAAPGATFLAVVDLQTHTPLLRDRDPLNIYRFSPRLYRLLSFAGCPNRARPWDYVQWLEQGGWKNVQVRPLSLLDREYLRAVTPHLAEPFRREEAYMELLGMVLVATRP